MIRCNLDLDCPVSPKDNLCCIYCKEKETCLEACQDRNGCCINIDGDEVYCERTGITITQDIATMTKKELQILLR